MPKGEDGIGFDVVKAIFRAQYQLSTQEFKALTLNNRSQRRKTLNNI